MDAIKLYVDREWIQSSNHTKNEILHMYLHLFHPDIIREYLMHIINNNLHGYYLIELTHELKQTFKGITHPVYNIPETNYISFLEYIMFLNEGDVEFLKKHPIIFKDVSFNTVTFLKYTPFNTMKELILSNDTLFKTRRNMFNLVCQYREDITVELLEFILSMCPPENNDELHLYHYMDTLNIKINGKLVVSLEIFDKLMKNSYEQIKHLEFGGVHSNTLNLMFSSFEVLEQNKEILDYTLISQYYRKIKYARFGELKKFIFKYPQLGWDWREITISPHTTFQDVLKHSSFPWIYQILSRNVNITEDDIDAHPEFEWYIDRSFQLNPNIGWKMAPFCKYKHYTGFRETYAKKITQHYIHKMMKYIL
jgi:hypothetical protein